VILAFTGTRRGMTPAQRAALTQVLPVLPERVLHGGAVGADNDFDFWIVAAGMPPENIEVYPVGDERLHFWRRLEKRTVHNGYWWPLARNRVMVERCDALLACPAEPTEVLRSGTWATIRYARAAGKPITIICPDGTITSQIRIPE
jgi:hypothetical protein